MCLLLFCGRVLVLSCCVLASWLREQKPTLPSLARFQALFKHPKKLNVAYESPRCLVHKPRRNLADESLYAYRRTQPFQHIHEEIQILINAESLEIFRSFCIFLLHPCAFNYLQLMEFDGSEWQLVYDGAGLQHHLTSFSQPAVLSQNHGHD